NNRATGARASRQSARILRKKGNRRISGQIRARPFFDRAQRTEVDRNRNQVRRLPPATTASHRAPEESRAAYHSRLVRLWLGQRLVARNAGNASENKAAHLGACFANSRSDPGRGVAGKRLHRDSSQAPPAGCGAVN